MENQKSCTIAASRRRGNLFKKATELAMLCGARIAVVAISKKGKVWLFPGSEVVIDIYDKYKESSLPNTRLVISREMESTESVEEAAVPVIERKKESRSDLESSLPDARLVLSRKRKSTESEEDAAVVKRMKELGNLVEAEDSLNQSWINLTLSLGRGW